ncbi:hypothetical protein [Streptomyces sp. NBC_01180]|uniref:hypothetical protein n=1 Tax=Streptomyces sp. NBC_01180 TaxID=2903763 RepID=UPI003870AF10|nr:hypothetical protein OG708_27140 [Streptomyces sp. NBC_01180]
MARHTHNSGNSQDVTGDLAGKVIENVNGPVRIGNAGKSSNPEPVTVHGDGAIYIAGNNKK